MIIGEYSPLFTEPEANNCFGIIFTSGNYTNCYYFNVGVHMKLRYYNIYYIFLNNAYFIHLLEYMYTLYVKCV